MPRRTLRPTMVRFLSGLLYEALLIFALLGELMLQLTRALSLEVYLAPVDLDLGEPQLQLCQLVVHLRLCA